MGCTQAKGNTVSTPVAQEEFQATKSNPLSEKEIQARIDAPSEQQSMTLAGIPIRYAWVSQRGYYPEALNKDNQDAYIIVPQLGNTKDQAYFAIYDGHGKDGHHCARYARDHLDSIPSSTVNSKTIKQALVAAHFATNEAMHTDKRFDDSLSGTTAISILFRGKMMYVCNVGDSRAIIVSTAPDGRLVAKPMSSDQTPYRKDERERCKRYGARILSMDQIEGIEPEHENWGDLNLGEDIDEGGDPPRIWSPNGDYPGTAFTRSLGDLFAEECGVVAEPEILEREITVNDRYIVIASDGVFEFLTNQMVADIINRHPDPVDACKAVVAQSYNMWLQYEVRTDDISIIALYIDDQRRMSIYEKSSSFYVEENASQSGGSTHGARPLSIGSGGILSGAASTTAAESIATPPVPEVSLEARPVRRVMSREKVKNMIQLKETEDDLPISEEEMHALIQEKSPEDAATITSAIRANFLFQHLSVQQRTAVVGVMRQVDVKKGDWVIRQGDQGDRFYVVDSGRFEVRVRQLPFPTSFELHNNRDPALGGSVVHVYESGPDNHPGFGELYGKPRAASVIALTDGKLWALDRRVFKRVVLRPKDMRRDIIRTLKKVELLKCLNVTQLQRLTDLLSEGTFEAGQYIITQGEPGETFYLIVSGNCDCTVNSTDGSPAKVVLQLKENNYFGERALLESKPRAANVIARTETKCLYIDKAAFEEVLGPLSKIIDEDRLRREALAAQEASSPKELKDIVISGQVSSDSMGPILLGSFRSPARPNVTIRSFVLSDIDKAALSDSMVRYIDGSKAVLAGAGKNAVIPQRIALIRNPNAVHLVLSMPIVSDLSAFVRSHSVDFNDNLDFIVYTFACLVSGLETLHDLHVIYRNVQPESIHIDALGRLVLMDYRVCKLGLGPNDKAFTICGASDYLAPEQISQTGHGYPVDFWGLGVLLYEIAVGSHPFSSNSEVATYSKISSFGSKTFPSLKFPDTCTSELKSLINQLLLPDAQARIGVAANGGFTTLKKHPFFKAFQHEWDKVEKGTYASPLLKLAVQECKDILEEGTDKEILDSFSLPCEVQTNSWLDQIEFN